MAQPQLLRALNMQAVLASIKERGPLSRADIARLTGLSRVTVSATVQALIGQGFVREREAIHTPLGKRAVPVELVPDVHYVLAGWANGDSLWVGSMDVAGTPVRRVQRRGVSSDADLTRELPDAVSEALSGVPLDRVLGLGLAIAGIVDPVRGVVVSSRPLGYQRARLAPRLTDLLGGLSVTLENGVNATLLGDYLERGGADRKASVVMLTFRHGVGGAIMLHGKLYRGQANMAGEVSELVTMGRTGTPLRLEDAVGEPGLVRRLKEVRPDIGGVEEALMAAEADRALRAVLEDAGERLAMAVVNLCLLLAPDTVVMTGPPWIQRVYYEPVRSAVSQGVPIAVGVRVLEDPLSAVLRGAAAVQMAAHPLAKSLLASASV